MLVSLLSFFRNNRMKLYPDDLKATLGYHERINRGVVTSIQAEVEALRKYVKELETAQPA
jgi:hypothetical protein